jgi:hypothetical protein
MFSLEANLLIVLSKAHLWLRALSCSTCTTRGAKAQHILICAFQKSN